MSAGARSSLPCLGAANAFLVNGHPPPRHTTATCDLRGRPDNVSCVANANVLLNAHWYAGERWSRRVAERDVLRRRRGAAEGQLRRQLVELREELEPGRVELDVDRGRCGRSPLRRLPCRPSPSLSPSWARRPFRLGLGLAFGLHRGGRHRHERLPCEVTFEVSAIGPEHRLPDVPPLHARVSASCGPVAELLVIDRAVARIVVNVASGLTGAVAVDGHDVEVIGGAGGEPARFALNETGLPPAPRFCRPVRRPVGGGRPVGRTVVSWALKLGLMVAVTVPVAVEVPVPWGT